ncbi:hypothetical protein TNCV_503341 [Trichonephila clavipes]|nr:hypothetical protein TNCV_503341 [Trichonephila clavipes]
MGYAWETNCSPIAPTKLRYRTEESSPRSLEPFEPTTHSSSHSKTATAGSDVVQSGRPIFDDFFQHQWPYIGNNAANVVFQMVKRLWLIRIDQ